MKNELSNAYSGAIAFAKSHYENFPVISLFIPKNLRKHVAVIYRFARQADDFADEGNLTEEERLNLLENYENDLSLCLNSQYKNSFWQALHNTIKELNLSQKYFYDLIKAFKQDVVKNRYNTFEEVKYYCKNSANPVGRLVLELFDIRDEQLNLYSDNICTALQLTNFYQDVKIDYLKNRIYIPSDELEKYNVNEKVFILSKINSNFKKLMKFQISRAKEFFNNGKPLFKYLPAMLKLEIKWTVLGGEAILNKIEKIDFDVLNKRPVLNKIDYFSLMIKSFFA